jgi:hypothetical protein
MDRSSATLPKIFRQQHLNRNRLAELGLLNLIFGLPDGRVMLGLLNLES